MSPNATRQASRDVYTAEQRLGSSLDGATKSGGVLNLDFCTYDILPKRERRSPLPSPADSGWFDVDTLTVLTRCYKTLIPREDYVTEVLAGVPDLYGASSPNSR